jgi:hypothetical protein
MRNGSVAVHQRRTAGTRFKPPPRHTSNPGPPHSRNGLARLFSLRAGSAASGHNYVLVVVAGAGA